MDIDAPQVGAQAAVAEEVVEQSNAEPEAAEAAAVKGKRGWPKGLPRPPKKAVTTANGEATAAAAPGTSSFPISRVAKIVKADKDIAMCQKEAIFLMSIATVSTTSTVKLARSDACEQEHFIKRLSDAAYTHARMDQSKQIRFKDLGTGRVLSDYTLTETGLRTAVAACAPENGEIPGDFFFLEGASTSRVSVSLH
jgi:hypothetical protein